MAEQTTAAHSAPMSDAVVQARTGRTWAEWLAILDAAGAATMSHQEIVAYLSSQHGVGDWWQQMVTVGYERERGLREKHQTPEVYSVSGSKTVAVPVAALYAAWEDDEFRQRWLADPAFTNRKTTPSKSLRITWQDGSTVDVLFYAKGEQKSQVTVDHGKLSDAGEAARMKAYWKEQLDRLKKLLEE